MLLVVREEDRWQRLPDSVLEIDNPGSSYTTVTQPATAHQLELIPHSPKYRSTASYLRSTPMYAGGLCAIRRRSGTLILPCSDFDLLPSFHAYHWQQPRGTVRYLTTNHRPGPNPL